MRANKAKDKKEYLETFLDGFEIVKLELTQLENTNSQNTVI
jgi:hypothetical protein